MISRCSSPMPGDDRLAGVVVEADAEGRIFLGERGSATEILSWSAFVLGSMATAITGSGKSIVSSRIGCCSAQSVSPVPTCLQADRGGDVAGVDLFDVFALVGVHEQQAADAAPLARGRVEDLDRPSQRARSRPGRR